MKRVKEKESVLPRLFREAKPILWGLVLGAVLDLVAVLCAVLAPDLMGKLVQRLYNFWADGAVGTVRNTLLGDLGLLLLVYAVGGLFGYLNAWLMNEVVSRHFTCNMRIRISEKLRRLPVRYVDQTPVGDVLDRMTEDVGEMGGYIHQLFDMMMKGGLQIVLIAVAMFLEDWRLAIFVVLITPLSLILSSKIASASERHYDELFAKSGELSGIVEESFSNYATSKAYNLESYTQQKHEQLNQALKKVTEKANFTGSIVQPLIRLSNAVAYLLINLIGGYLVIRQGVSVGAVVTIVLYARQFASPLEQLAGGFSQFNRVKAASKRVFTLLDMEEMSEQTGALPKKREGQVTFSHVDFSYKPEEPLIADLNLSVKPGQKVAIVGPTGAGKTTIVNLLMRFYDPNAGQILLDGQDVGAVDRDQVRASFGMVLQDTWLFRGTVAENLAYGKPDATMDEIREAAKQTYCDHFIRTMPDGYDTVIGEDTTNLSGGQRQLLTIARALLADRPLLILDEATSNVDTRTEVLIQKAMDRLMAGRTCFVIAHRLSTIVDSDVILVLNHGQIVEQGTHKELLEMRGFYHEIYTSQYAV